MADISKIQLPDGTTYGIRAGAIPFGEVDSTSTSTVFTATVPGIAELIDGTTVMLRNGRVTSASGFTLNVNGLGAKPVYNNLATGNDETPTNPTRDTTIFNINYTMLFVYQSDLVSGGAWICYRGYDGNTNTIGYQLRTNSGNLPAIEAGYRYRIWLTALDGLHWVPINTSTSTDATTSRSLNTRVIDPFGPIVYNSTNGTVAKDVRPAVGTLWQQYTLTIGYSYVKTLTAWKPVYLKCTPQSGGGVVMNDIVQALPTSADGKVYIYLGQAYSTTAIELRQEHPVYYYKDGAIRLWSNAAEADIPTKTSELENDSGFITTETDPTVPSWAKASTKPSYTATEVGAVATTAVGAANGVAPLNSSSKIDSTYLPSYVDDVLEYSAKSSFPSTGETGKIYVDTSTNKTYRWGGTAYVEISPSQVVSAAQDLTSGTKVGSVTIDGTKTQFYAPTPPTVPSNTGNSTTGISISNHGTGTVIGVQSNTTTASKVTLGTAFSVPNVTSAGSASTWVFEEKSIPNVTSAGSGSFTQGSFFGGSFTQGTDSFTPNTPTVINTSKFNGGSFTQGSDSFTKPTHGADSFTPASFQTGFYTAGSATTPAVIDTTKFNGGSYSHTGFSGGSFTRGTFSGGSLVMAIDTTDTKKLNITFTAATHANDTFTAATYGTDNFTAASLASGFYTAGTKGTPTTINTSKFNGGSFTQGSFTQGSFTQGADSFTPASFQTGFYTAGTSADFEQGVDEFTPATHGVDSHTHIAPTIGTAIKVQSKKSGANSTAPTLGTAFTIPNVTNVDDVTVPIKNTSASTFVTGTTHTITDNGHTHSI